MIRDASAPARALLLLLLLLLVVVIIIIIIMIIVVAADTCIKIILLFNYYRLSEIRKGALL